MTLSIAPKATYTAFQIKTGVAIMWPFLGPVGTDTGVAATSSYNVSPYTNPTDFTTHVGSWLTSVALSAGFDHVRLMCNPGPLLECIKNGQTGVGSREATLISQITSAISTVITAGLKCYLDLHLTGYVTGYDTATYLDGTAGSNFLRYKQMVTDVATAVATAGFTPQQFALELFNEPPDPATFAGDWATMQPALVAAARAVLPNHTLICTAAGYSHPDSVVAFNPSGYDKNIIWTAHHYPLSSLQGYQLSSYSKYFDSYPWEKRPDDRARILGVVTTRVNADVSVPGGSKTTVINSTMANVDDMFTKGRDYIDSQISELATWAQTYGVSVMLGEMGIHAGSSGAINPAAVGMPEESRIRNTSDFSSVCAKYGVARTFMAPDSADYHIPGAPGSSLQTLDTLPANWLAALAPGAGWLTASSSG